MDATVYDPTDIDRRLHQQRLRITETYMECGTCGYEPPDGIIQNRRHLTPIRLLWCRYKCPKCGCYTIVPVVRIRMILAIKWAESIAGKRLNGYHVGKYNTVSRKDKP